MSSIQTPFSLSFMVFNPSMILMSSCPMTTMTSIARLVNKYQCDLTNWCPAVYQPFCSMPKKRVKVEMELEICHVLIKKLWTRPGQGSSEVCPTSATTWWWYQIYIKNSEIINCDTSDNRKTKISCHTSTIRFDRQIRLFLQMSSKPTLLYCPIPCQSQQRKIPVLVSSNNVIVDQIILWFHDTKWWYYGMFWTNCAAILDCHQPIFD